ncbi:MAG TPA: benzoate-CoA ligase family protein [Acidimicrobiales bacterium]|nr:benzoate-CoA ligase family protein [Acidimicrobiales bacterium]
MDQYNAAAWLLDRQLEAGHGDRTAYRIDGVAVTYAELQQEVWRAQNALRRLDVRRGERVALVVDDELAFPAWLLGGLRAGAVPVPLSTMLTGDELAAIVADAEAGTVVVSDRYREQLPTIGGRASELRQAVVIGEPADAGDLPVHGWSDFTDRGEAPVAATGPDSPAFWLYSSGTTGLPKGVMHRHASLQATADTYARSILEIGPEDRCLSVPKLFFAYGLGNSLTFPLSVGASAVLNPRPPTPPEVLDLVRAEQPTLFFATPGFVAALLDADPADDAFASVRCTVTAGEALPADLQRRFSGRFGHPVLDGIGSTEALHIFLSNTKGAERPGTSGVPVPGYEARLVDDAGRELAEADTPGRLQVRGPSVATGYWCRDAASRAAFQGEWLVTGDVYSRSVDGYWTFLGRNNDMIKAGGIWVSPAEVEGVLVEQPDVLEAAVVGGRDAQGLEVTVAFVVPRSGHQVDTAAVEAHCRDRMAGFKRPRRIEVVDGLPKTPTGKIQRFALRERLDAEAPAPA